MINKIAFLTTIFPMNENYLYDFFNSLDNQTYKNFDIVLVNDNYANFEIIKNKYSQLNIIELVYSNTPAKNREYGINYCINSGYDILIFGDSDDYFDNNRIFTCIKYLKKFDIIINDLSLFDDNGIYINHYISTRIQNDSIIDLEFIKDKNIFGLSNSALKLQKLKNIIIPEDLIAVDWYILTILLLEGLSAVFTNKTTSYYRQYEQNTIGLRKLDLKTFKKSISIKKSHYKYFSYIKIFEYEITKVNNLREDDFYKMNKTNLLWWELI